MDNGRMTAENDNPGSAATSVYKGLFWPWHAHFVSGVGHELKMDRC